MLRHFNTIHVTSKCNITTYGKPCKVYDIYTVYTTKDTSLLNYLQSKFGSNSNKTKTGMSNITPRVSEAFSKEAK